MQQKLEKHTEDTLPSYKHPIIASCRAWTGAFGLADGSEAGNLNSPILVMLYYKLFVQSRTDLEACSFFRVSTTIFGCSVHTEVLGRVTNML